MGRTASGPGPYAATSGAQRPNTQRSRRPPCPCPPMTSKMGRPARLGPGLGRAGRRWVSTPWAQHLGNGIQRARPSHAQGVQNRARQRGRARRPPGQGAGAGRGGTAGGTRASRRPAWAFHGHRRTCARAVQRITPRGHGRGGGPLRTRIQPPARPIPGGIPGRYAVGRPVAPFGDRHFAEMGFASRPWSVVWSWSSTKNRHARNREKWKTGAPLTMEQNRSIVAAWSPMGHGGALANIRPPHSTARSTTTGRWPIGRGAAHGRPPAGVLLPARASFLPHARPPERRAAHAQVCSCR